MYTQSLVLADKNEYREFDSKWIRNYERLQKRERGGAEYEAVTRCCEGTA